MTQRDGMGREVGRGFKIGIMNMVLRPAQGDKDPAAHTVTPTPAFPVHLTSLKRERESNVALACTL